MSGQGGKYSGIGVFNRIRDERDRAIDKAAYWEKRARESQNAAYNSGVWSGVIGCFCVLSLAGGILVFVFG